MGKNPDDPSDQGTAGGEFEGKDSREMLIGHLTTMWESERENADCIRRRIELISGAMVALLGFGFFSIQWIYQTPARSTLFAPRISTWLLRAILALIVYCFARGLVAIYIDIDVRKKNLHDRASHRLEIIERDLNRPIRLLLIHRLSTAYNYLKIRNEKERNRLILGEKWFAYSLTLLLLVLFLYLLLAAPQMANP